MTDQALGALGADQAEGQPPVDSGAATQQPQTPKPLTADDLAEFEQRIERRLQSLTAKQENRLKKQFDEQFQVIQAKYAALDMPVPERVKQELAEKLVAQSEQDATQQAAQPARSDAPDPVMRRANDIARQVGGLDPQREEDKPFYALVNYNTDDPFEFIESVQKAADAKSAWLAQQRQQRAGPPGSGAPMSVQAAPAGGDLRAEYERRKQGLRPGSEQMLQLRNEMRRKGLTDI